MRMHSGNLAAFAMLALCLILQIQAFLTQLCILARINPHHSIVQCIHSRAIESRQICLALEPDQAGGLTQFTHKTCSWLCLAYWALT